MSQTAIITGSAKGIGKGIAIKLAKDGFNLVLADFDESQMNKTLEELVSTGVKATAIKTDVSSRSDVQNLVKFAVEKFGSVEVLVNNAGIFPFKPFLEMTDEDWDKVLNVNTKSVFMLTQEVAKIMPENGRIVSISSIASQVGFEGLTHYCASKGAINAFTRAVALELASKKITVNVVAPGSVETPGASTTAMSEDAKKGMLAMIPLSRSGLPADIAAAVSYLVSSEASYITGQVITVDGGWTLR